MTASDSRAGARRPPGFFCPALDPPADGGIHHTQPGEPRPPEHAPMTTKPSKLTKEGKRVKKLPRASVVVSALPIGE